MENFLPSPLRVRKSDNYYYGKIITIDRATKKRIKGEKSGKIIFLLAPIIFSPSLEVLLVQLSSDHLKFIQPTDV